jgi:cysteinyl-tRNA synthetase
LAGEPARPRGENGPAARLQGKAAKMVEIRLRNSMTGKVEPLEPTVKPGEVSMYVCGPTVYDRAHLGNARPVVVFDVLYRLLKHRYGPENVTYVRNITDVEDKIIDRAAERGVEIDELTRTTTEWFHEDMAALGVDYRDDPQFKEPRATDYIPQMVAMIETLIERGHAYAEEGHVLFDVHSYEAYGRLSGRSVEDMIAGARVEVAPYKRDPMDFVLWKPSSDDQPGWDGPVVGGKSVGRGRPGWHIECSAMSHALLGESFDIHGGGIDLQFPHHENEIAQSCCAHPEGGFARIWMHNEMLQVEGKKMSKSLGNFFTVRDLLEQDVPGEVIRFVMLSTHYSKPMDWTEKKREEAEKSLRRWRLLVDGIEPSEPAPEIVKSLANDLNTREAVRLLGHFGQVLFQKAGRKFERPNAESVDESWFDLAEEFVASANLVGLLLPQLAGWTEVPDLHPYARQLARLRDTALATKDFSRVDALKAALVAAGIEVRMSKEGVDLVPGQGFDPAKLEALL